MNSVTLIGRLTRDPEVKYTPTQVAIGNFTIAIDRPVKQGEEKQTDFPRITVFGKQAENCEKFLAKGSLVGIQGRLETNGQYMNVKADRVEFLERKKEPEPHFEQIDGDIPF